MKEKFAVIKYCGKQIGDFEFVKNSTIMEMEHWHDNNYKERCKISFFHGKLYGKLWLSGFMEFLFKRHKLDMIDTLKFEIEIYTKKICYVLNHIRFNNLDYKEYYEYPEKEVSTIIINSVNFCGQLYYVLNKNSTNKETTILI